MPFSKPRKNIRAARGSRKKEQGGEKTRPRPFHVQPKNGYIQGKGEYLNTSLDLYAKDKGQHETLASEATKPKKKKGTKSER